MIFLANCTFLRFKKKFTPNTCIEFFLPKVDLEQWNHTEYIGMCAYFFVVFLTLGAGFLEDASTFLMFPYFSNSHHAVLQPVVVLFDIFNFACYILILFACFQRGPIHFFPGFSGHILCFFVVFLYGSGSQEAHILQHPWRLFSNISSRNFGAVAASLSWVKGAGAELAAMPPALGQGWRGEPRPPHPHDPGPW